MKERYYNILKAIEAERLAEEQYFQGIASSKTLKERTEAGVLWYPVQIERSHYTIGEKVELELSPKKPDQLKRRHNFKVGASAELFIQEEEKKSYRGAISYVGRKKVRIILSSDSLSMSNFEFAKNVGIELIYDDRPYRVMRTSIETVIQSQEPAIRELREAFSERKIDDIIAHDHAEIEPAFHLNNFQIAAIKGCLNTYRLGIIHGPPGTGKTTTIVGLIKELIKSEKRVLVCAPSNNAVDLLARQISALDLKVLRIGNVTRIGDNIAHLSLSEKCRNHKDWQHIKKVKIEAEDAKREGEKFKRSFGPQERKNRNAMFNEARQLRQWARDLEDRLVETVISDSQVICSTLIGCAHPQMRNLTFNTVIIDEGSQALEPECWTAILKGQRVIIAGDHKQLPPTVKSTEARDLEFETTLLDLMTDSIKQSFLLGIQYRMNQAILGFSNMTFYNDQLISADFVKNRLLETGDQPLVFIDTSGCGFEEEQNVQNRSYRNRSEFLILREHFLSEKEKYSEQTIGIVSPYANQVRLIRQEVEQDAELNSFAIEVNSIDGFQGQERDIIYISLVRSNEKGNIGFLKDYRRLNVAMTRAKMKLVIIGDMSTLSSDKTYSSLADHIEEKGLYQSAWEYMV